MDRPSQRPPRKLSVRKESVPVALGKKAAEEALKATVDNLVRHEVRLLHLERLGAPSFVLGELATTIREMKKELINLIGCLPQREGEGLIKRTIREALEEEIERTVGQRGKPCLRCARLRYYDSELNPHFRFPVGTRPARALGCDQLSDFSGVRCRRFVETGGRISTVGYIEELNLLYEMRDRFKRMKEIGKGYLHS